MDTIVDRIAFGVGRRNDEPVDHPVLDASAPDSLRSASLTSLAAKQLGTVGAGNHYVDLFADETTSSGSACTSARAASATRRPRAFLDAGRRAKGGMDVAPPILRASTSDLGQDYIAAMTLAGRYAYAGRDWVVRPRCSRSCWRDGYWKRSTTITTSRGASARAARLVGGPQGLHAGLPGQQGFVGWSMGEPCVILEGGSRRRRAALYSTVHGAGRRLSRTQANGKKGRPGLIDCPTVQADLRERGIELRGGAADEAPDAYKRLDEVLADHGDTIRVLHRLEPIGVAMAGADTSIPTGTDPRRRA